MKFALRREPLCVKCSLNKSVNSPRHIKVNFTVGIDCVSMTLYLLECIKSNLFNWII
jgi:NADH:ubiquinone oxidoreductase subunit 4 (subunit M)